ncbi:helix-turn-helix domain-containing protein [Candidatus Kaiserbacteria bacterium]|nr:helix-turn-helix domain-containing protein [Candidatus Kaiserbacteria bacterium]
MSDDVVVDGETFISSRRASESSGYAQDHIGYLARKGVISARRIGGLWYISEHSLGEYKQQAESYKPEPPNAASRTSDPEIIVSFDGREYVSATKGAELTGYHQDYVAQLAREGRILSRQIGTRWYIDRYALLAHKKEKDALLGAVQSEAVGLRKSPPSRQGQAHDEGGPYMTYTRDESDLLPIIKSDSEHRSYESRKGDTPISAYIPITHPISIRKISIPMESRERRTRKSRRLPVGITAAVATIVIVVVVGYVSIQSSVLFTSATDRELNFALSGRAAKALSLMGDFIENIVAPEITYIREK